jgi:outer membrane protein assembly factor BamB
MLLLILANLAWPTASTAAGTGSWTQYAHDAQRSGKDPLEQTAFSSVSHEWDALVDGDVYGQPLVFNGRVLVVTEENSVYSFDATTGAQVWKKSVGAPVASTVVPNGCSPINPHIGITSTPAIDTTRGRIYVVAQEGAPLRYDFFGLDLATGNIVVGPITLDPWPGATQADKAAQDAVQIQRSALLLVNDTVYVTWGGRAECGPGSPQTFQGWVVSVPLATPGTGMHSFFAPKPSGGGASMWGPAGPSADSAGNVYIATGNGFITTGPANLGESVVKFSPSLTMLDHWTASNWASLNANDFDVGSHTPSHLGSDLVFQSGKDGRGFLLRESSLGGGTTVTTTGGELFTSATRICPGTSNTRSYGLATWLPPHLFVPCMNGIQGLQVTTTAPVSFRTVWQGPATSYPSSPMIAGGALWYIDAPSKTLTALDPATGAGRFNFLLPNTPAHFATPASGNGRIYAATFGHLSSYRLVSTTPATATPTTVPPTATPTPTATGTTTVTLNPVADTYTARSAPNSTAGGTSLTLRSDVVGTDTAFLRFDLSQLAGKTITAAALRLHTSTEAWAGSTVVHNIKYVASNDWKEQFMTFNNTVAPTSIASSAMATILGTAPNTFYQSSALPTSTVQARAGLLISMAIDAPSGDVLIFYSRESGAATAPQLVVTYR